MTIISTKTPREIYDEVVDALVEQKRNLQSLITSTAHIYVFPNYGLGVKFDLATNKVSVVSLDNATTVPAAGVNRTFRNGVGLKAVIVELGKAAAAQIDRIDASLKELANNRERIFASVA